MKVKSKFGLLALGLALAAGSLVGCKTGGGGGKPTPIRYEVSWNESSLYTVTGIEEDGYLKGDDVNFTITLASPDDYRVTSVTSDEVNIRPANRGLDYTFKMPAEDVNIRISTEQIPKWVANLKLGEEEVDGMEAEYELKYGTTSRTSFTIEADPEEATVNNITHKVLFNKSGDVELTFKDGGEVRYVYTAHPRAAQEGETRKTAVDVARATAIATALPDPTSYKDGIGSTSTDRPYWVKGMITGLYKSDGKGHHFYLDNTKFELYGVKELPEGVTNPEDVFGANVLFYAKLEKLSFNSGSSFVYENDTLINCEIDSETLTGLKQIALNPAYSLQDGTLQLPNLKMPACSSAQLSYVVTGEHATVDENTGLVTFVSAGDVTITVTYGNFSSVLSFTIVDGEVGDWYRVATAPEAGNMYRLVLDRENASTKGGNWYLDGGTGSANYYLSTTQDASKALRVTVIAADDGFKLQVGDKYLFVGAVGTHKNSLYKDTLADATVFSFDETLGIPFVTISNAKYWLGNDPAKTFTEAQATDFTAHPTNYKVYLECFGVEPDYHLEGVSVTPENAIVDVYAGAKTKQFSVSPIPAVADLGEVTWSIVEEGSKLTVVDGLVTIPQDAVEVDHTATFTVRATAGDYHDDAIITVKRATPGSGGQGTEDSPYSPAEARAFIDTFPAGSLSEERVYVAGIVCSKGAWNSQFSNFDIYFQSEDGLDEKYFESYRTKLSGTITYDSIKAGDYVVVEGLAKVYNGQYELSTDAGNANNPTVVSVESRDPVLLGIKMNKDTVSVGIGGTEQLSVVPIPSYATLPTGTAEWASSASTKASVVNGLVTGVAATGEGETVTITATLGGKVAQCEVSVLGVSEVYKLDATIAQSDDADHKASKYDQAYGVTQGGVEWLPVANTTMSPWRFGGKSITNQDRTLTSNGVVSSSNIQKVAVKLGDIFSDLTFNSLTLKVGSAAGGSEISTLTETTLASQATIEFVRPEGADWTSRYFTLVFNVTVAGTSNKAVQLQSVTFYA